MSEFFASTDQMNVVPGVMILAQNDSDSEALYFGVDVTTKEGGSRFTVRHTRREVEVIRDYLNEWLSR